MNDKIIIFPNPKYRVLTDFVEADFRYYKGVRPCIIVFRGKKKVIIRFLDDHTECITLVRLCWRHKK